MFSKYIALIKPNQLLLFGEKEHIVLSRYFNIVISVCCNELPLILPSFVLLSFSFECTQICDSVRHNMIYVL